MPVESAKISRVQVAICVVLVLMAIVGSLFFRDSPRARALPAWLVWHSLYERGPDGISVWVAADRPLRKCYLRFESEAENLRALRIDEFGLGESPEFVVVLTPKWSTHIEAITVANSFCKDSGRTVGIIAVDPSLKPINVSLSLASPDDFGPWWFTLNDWEVTGSFVTLSKDDARMWLERQVAEQ